MVDADLHPHPGRGGDRPLPGPRGGRHPRRPHPGGERARPGRLFRSPPAPSARAGSPLIVPALETRGGRRTLNAGRPERPWGERRERPASPAPATSPFGPRSSSALESVSRGIRDPAAKLRFIRAVALAVPRRLDHVVQGVPFGPVRRRLYRWLSLERLRHLLDTRLAGRAAAASTARTRRAVALNRLGTSRPAWSCWRVGGRPGRGHLSRLPGRQHAPRRPPPPTRPSRRPLRRPSRPPCRPGGPGAGRGLAGREGPATGSSTATACASTPASP